MKCPPWIEWSRNLPLIPFRNGEDGGDVMINISLTFLARAKSTTVDLPNSCNYPLSDTRTTHTSFLLLIYE